MYTYNIIHSLFLCSPSLSRLHSSPHAVSKRLKLFRKAKKMSKKPPIPEKSDRIKNLPVPRPRNAGPPPKPPPYNNHRKVLKKPDPAPRRINRQQIEAPLAATPPNNHLPGTSPVEDASLSPDTGGQNFTPPSPRGEYSGGSAQRPRLDTPVTPPDPASIPPTQNGVLSPPVPLVRSGAAAAALSKAHTPLADDSGDRKLITPNVESKCMGKSPLPTPQDSRECANSVTSQELQYAEAYGVSDKADNADENLYSTVSDSPRRFITPPPSDPPPPAPLSHSVAPPPVPLPRSSAVTHPLPPLPVTGTSESEYNVTSHVAEACGKQPTPPPPTLPDTYSALARPDQPQKSLNPVPPDSLSQTYSSLDQDGIHQPAPVVKPVEQVIRIRPLGYGNILFTGVSAVCVYSSGVLLFHFSRFKLCFHYNTYMYTHMCIPKYVIQYTCTCRRNIVHYKYYCKAVLSLPISHLGNSHVHVHM